MSNLIDKVIRKLRSGIFSPVEFGTAGRIDANSPVYSYNNFVEYATKYRYVLGVAEQTNDQDEQVCLSLVVFIKKTNLEIGGEVKRTDPRLFSVLSVIGEDLVIEDLHYLGNKILNGLRGRVYLSDKISPGNRYRPESVIKNFKELDEERLVDILSEVITCSILF